MKLQRARRNVEVFDIAIVAVVTKAMGAFLVIMILLLPYYKTNPQFARVAGEFHNELSAASTAVSAVRVMLLKPEVDSAAVRAALDVVQKHVTEAQAYVAAVRNTLDALSAQNERLQKDLETLSAQLAAASAEIANLRVTNSQLSDANTVLESENSKLRQDNATQKAELERQRTETETIAAKLKSAEAQLAEITDLRMKVASLEEQNKRALSETESVRAKSSELEADNKRLVDQLKKKSADDVIGSQDVRARISALEDENRRLRGRGKGQARQASGTEDIGIVRRWFSGQVTIEGCPTVDFALYARWEGLLDVPKGADSNRAKPFDTTKPEDITLINGVTYVTWLRMGDRFGFPKEAKLSAIAGLGDTIGVEQIKSFQGVSRSSGDWSIYIAAVDPASIGTRECSMKPAYFGWGSGSFGEEIVLTEKRPFAWLRRFAMKADGSLTLDKPPKLDEEFKKKLEAFSQEQSAKLCQEKSICGTEDAHLFQLKSEASFVEPAIKR